MVSEPAHPPIGKMVGARIREARKARNLTQGQLAGDDFSVSYISAIERGQINPSLRALELFAQRLGLSSKELLLASASQVRERGEARGSSLEEDADWHLLIAHILLLQDAYEQAIPIIKQLMQEPLTPLQKIRSLYLLALAHARTDRWQESDHFISEATRLVKDAASPLALSLLDLKGVVQAHIHGYTQGEDLIQQCLDLLEEQQPLDIFFKAKVSAQLGYQMLQAGRIAEARNLLEGALQQARSLTLAEMAAMYIELSRQDTPEVIQAELAIYKSLQALWRMAVQARHSELHYMLGRATLRTNRDQAQIYLTSTLQEAPSDPFIQGGAHAHLAMWELAGQNMAEARSHAKQAHALLQSAGDSLVAADAHFALGAIEYAQKRYKAGDTQFEAGLAILERLHAGEELAEQYAQYAQLLENRGDLLRATHYWKKAYQVRQAMKA